MTPTKTGRLWCYAVDNRPWSGPGHPAAAYAYSEDRKGEPPATHLKGFRGLLQVDGYAGFGGLVTGGANDAPTLAFCWAHARRKFYDVHAATKSPLAHEALQRIGAPYAIEADIRGQTAEQRQQVRQQRSRPPRVEEPGRTDHRRPPRRVRRIKMILIIIDILAKYVRFLPERAHGRWFSSLA